MNPFALSHFLLSLAILLFVWLFVLDRLRRDDFRSELRRIRDELFDFMWENGFDYQTPAYLETRQLLNGMIRVSHYLTPPNVIVSTVVLLTDKEPDWKNGKTSELVDVRLSTQINKAQNEAIGAFITFLFLGGLLGLVINLIVLLLRPILWILNGKRTALQYLATLKTAWIGYAYTIGDPNGVLRRGRLV